MELFDINETQHLRREEAAARLHALADSLARQQRGRVRSRNGRITVRVPDEVDLKIEVELGDDGNRRRSSSPGDPVLDEGDSTSSSISSDQRSDSGRPGPRRPG